MLRLLLFVAATLVGLFFLSLVYDGGDSAASNQAAVAEEPSPVTTKNVTEEAKDFIEEVVAGPQPSGAEGAPPADLVQAADQTPEKVQRFPGPKLRPSPEYTGQTPQAPAVAATGDNQVLYVTAERVNFRAGPSTNDRVIGSLDGGASVEALGPTDAEWINIRDANGRVGYLSGQFLSTQAPD